jgi:hypothetical protein
MLWPEMNLWNLVYVLRATGNTAVYALSVLFESSKSTTISRMSMQTRAALEQYRYVLCIMPQILTLWKATKVYRSNRQHGSFGTPDCYLNLIEPATSGRINPW